MTATETIKAVQRLIGAADDGDFGNKSQAALEAFVLRAKAENSTNLIPGVVDERSRKNIDTLLPKVQTTFVRFLTDLNVALAPYRVVAKIISGTRTYAEQNALYAQGRTKPGKVVTNATGGASNHNFGVAADIGLFKDGKYLSESPLYRTAGAVGKSLGLNWGGDWKGSIVDEPHFEYPTGLTLSQMRDRVASNTAIV